MTSPGHFWLRGLDYGGPGATLAAGFYRDLWGLTPVAEEDGHAFFRATGTEPYVLGLHDGERKGLRSINFGVEDRPTLDALLRHLGERGATVIEAIRPLDTPGGGEGFDILDPDRRVLRFSTGVTGPAGTADAIDRPRKVSHVVLNSTDLDRAKDFYCDVLGMRVSDWSENQMVFLRCRSDHHSIAFNRADRNSINHVAFEMPSIDAFMRGIGRMRNGGYPVNWGPGRHGPGNNPFAYFIGPSGFVIEYTAEIQQIDEATHVAQVWERTPPKSDLWGTAGPPSAQMRAAMAGDPDAGWPQAGGKD